MARRSFLYVGDIVGTHGLKGALTIYSHTRPANAVAGYSCWWLGDSDEETTPYPLRRCWQHGKRILAELEGVTDCDAAAALKGKKIWIPADEVTLLDGEYLWEDLIGCRVVQGDQLLGYVTALEEYGAQDNLRVETALEAAEPGEWLIPFIDAIIISVDLEAALITVDLPEGMDACFTPRC